MSGLPQNLLTEISQVLQNCEQFDDAQSLKALFVDDRISLWRDSLPEANSDDERVSQTIDYLFDKRNAVMRENGLVLLLQVLSDKFPPNDQRYHQLKQVAKQLRQVVVDDDSWTDNNGLFNLLGLHAVPATNMIVTTVVTLILLVTWGVSLMTTWPFLLKFTVVLQVLFICLIPLLLQVGASILNISVGKYYRIAVSILLMVAAASLFSTFPGKSLPELPPTEERLRGMFSGEYTYLRGSESCDQQERPCMTRMRVTQDYSYRVRNSDGTAGPLHLLLDVEWHKRELYPSLRRNYKGRLYYTVHYQCERAANAQVNRDPDLIGYQMRPSRIFLSWMIGFIEIPFVLDTDKGISEKIIQAVQNYSDICI